MIAKGTRVSLHPATSYWMQGDRYGEVVGIVKKRTSGPIPYRVKLDSGRVVSVHPLNVEAIATAARAEAGE